jgi:DNA (cytosine-5)-methyltransferase 1
LPLWFCQIDNRTGKVKRRNLDTTPMFTIAAAGTGDIYAKGYWLEHDGCDMKLWVEQQVGHSKGTRNTRKFEGHAHEFVDRTDSPSPTIVAARPVSIAIERSDASTPMTSAGKPEYRVPTMAEIGEMPWNGYNVVSTFAGCGGSSTGYRMAGFRVLLASEFVEAARETYSANMRPGTILDGRDIREVTAEDLLQRIGMKPGELDVLDGSPPCASFSTAGKREKAWGTVKKYSDTEQRADDLFFEFARLVKGIQPKVFVAENVSGLVKGTAKGYFLEILAALKACGYRVEARLLDAQWLGVPQMRQRLIFVGVRNDLCLAPAHPAPLSYRYSIRDALPWLTRVVHDTSGEFGVGVVTDRPSPAITVGVNSINSYHFKVEGPEVSITHGNGSSHSSNRGKQIDPNSPAPTVMAREGRNGDQFIIDAAPVKLRRGATAPSRQSRGEELSIDNPIPSVLAGSKGSGPHQFEIEEAADITRFAIGTEWDKLKEGEKSKRYFSLVRPSRGSPSPTITACGGSGPTAGVAHPTEKRKFSIMELRRICGFPDDFILKGTYAQQWERLGRAVPPVMMSHIAATVRDEILAKLPK